MGVLLDVSQVHFSIMNLPEVLDEDTAADHKYRLDLLRSDRAGLGVAQTDGVTWISNSTEAQRVCSPLRTSYCCS